MSIDLERKRGSEMAACSACVDAPTMMEYEYYEAAIMHLRV